ncbi:hypothetical protein OESDEN_03045 [Oesophagostomum dentatum]|uniref:Uncharacterized protein n=1 Tax=Oesophagostomum dentatum TaxID=61180 RepID=A0A0B1TNK0_OESDE|nr:hypothetical protein OESDEN_03045 [Oesophagostomum dentatum]
MLAVIQKSRSLSSTVDTSDSEDEPVFGSVSDQDNEGIVEEKEDEEKQGDASNGLLLGDYLKDYLKRMKQDDFGLPTRSTIKGNELVIWRPITEFRDPFEDPSMKGRIQEVEGGENSTDEVSTPHIVTESGDSESDTEMSSQTNPRQTPNLKIEDVTEQSIEGETMECD